MRAARAALLLPSLLLTAAAAPAAPTWSVSITQVDGTNQPITDAAKVDCPIDGCQLELRLFVDYKAQPFLAGISFVDKGAYVALQPMAPALGQAIDFQKGFRGPVFVKIQAGEREKIDTLRFTLTGPAVPDGGKGTAPIMNNAQSLVFHRKLSPDLILRVDLIRPKAAS
jgi:hypothetical protein